MSWYPIAFIPPQFETLSGVPYSGAVLKAYAAGTTTNIFLATDYTGETTVSSVSINAAGFPTYGGAVIIPHVQEDYKLALYPTQAAADSDSGALWAVDDIKIADDTNTAFIEAFDGDGTTSVFTLSQDLGTDEKSIMVFVDRILQEYQSNGDFAEDTSWDKGSGWTISSGVATAKGAISTDLSQTSALALVEGESYTITFTITCSAGGVIPKIGGTSGTEKPCNYVSNGTFSSDVSWTKDSGWTIASNVATATGAISTALSQTSISALIKGHSYDISYTVTLSAGTVTASVGETAGTARSAAGDYTETIVAGASQTIAFTGSGFTGTVSKVRVTPSGSGTYSETIIAGDSQIIAFSGNGFTGTVDAVKVTQGISSQRQILYHTEYVLSGNQLILSEVPPRGTKNIIVFAPSLLLGAASSSAASAATSEMNASTSASAAAISAAAASNYAGAMTGHSTTAKTIATGSVSITIETGKIFSVGQTVVMASDAAPSTNWMSGQITSYSSTTGILVVDVDVYGGSGSHSDWTVGISGPVGATGPTGATGAGTGDMLAAQNLNDLDNKTTARSNLGLKSAAELDSIDEDSMASNSATKLPTQQSVKAYVDGLAASAWGKFDGTSAGSITPAASYNIGSVNNSSTGVYNIAFSSAMANANYVVVCESSSATPAMQNTCIAPYGSKTINGFTIWTGNSYTPALSNHKEVSFVVFGGKS